MVYKLCVLILGLAATYHTSQNSNKFGMVKNDWNIKVVLHVKIYGLSDDGGVKYMALMKGSRVFQWFLVEKRWGTGLSTNTTLNKTVEPDIPRLRHGETP